MGEKKSWYGGVPVPVDRNGAVVPLDTKRLADENGQKLEVSTIEYQPIISTWFVRFMGQTCSTTLSRCALAPTDSWEKLADDLARYDEHKVTCEYFGMAVDGTCDGCRGHHHGISCIASTLDDVARRVRALRKAERDED